MPETRRQIARPKPQAATRMGTQGTILAGVDMRTHGARRFRELVADLVHHLDGDPTPPQIALVRRAAALSVWCEAQEAAQAAGGDLDSAAYSSAANTLRRLLSDLGIERRARDVTPSLADYLARRASNEG
jgi:hypothetical protein